MFCLQNCTASPSFFWHCLDFVKRKHSCAVVHIKKNSRENFCTTLSATLKEFCDAWLKIYFLYQNEWSDCGLIVPMMLCTNI
ncbi:hypothetical protein DOY81_011138 [Sarcophaga bullata]|nr:hypothetical protein DOY81_011138 [Sarcophaga bullata]